MVKPNILLLMTDQQRADALGCSGGWLETPHMDRIAAGGVRFENCITNSPVCIPARLSLATGLYPHNTGVWTNQPSQLNAEQPTWMQRVRDAGYRTSLFGKTHLHPHNGDLRDREYLMKTYGLDDVDEIGGPRASARVLSIWASGTYTKTTTSNVLTINHIWCAHRRWAWSTMPMSTLVNAPKTT